MNSHAHAHSTTTTTEGQDFQFFQLQIHLLLSKCIGLGRVLFAIQKSGCYRPFYDTIEAFCLGEYKFQAVQTRNYLKAGEVVTNLLDELHHAPVPDAAFISKVEMWSNVKAACELAEVAQKKRAIVLKKAFELSGPAGPTAPKIKDAIAKVVHDTDEANEDKRTTQRHKNILQLNSVIYFARKNPHCGREVDSSVEVIMRNMMERKSVKFTRAKNAYEENRVNAPDSPPRKTWAADRKKEAEKKKEVMKAKAQKKAARKAERLKLKSSIPEPQLHQPSSEQENLKSRQKGAPANS
ncbi:MULTISPECIES: hypothetical protein [unclassified Ereboglobus]|uniref:hypothetical protein n=1 Tax=unclassified Ereboglobus TaxID=2626932 RepID=UPI00240738CB|nr:MULTISPECIES: hypothetical protein [unclassified Ereboglobus]